MGRMLDWNGGSMYDIQDLEEIASREFVDRSERDPQRAHEIVALGVLDPRSSAPSWIEEKTRGFEYGYRMRRLGEEERVLRGARFVLLPNTHPTGIGKFEVTEADLRIGIERLVKYIERVAGRIRIYPEEVVLWHSHYVDVRPSADDVEAFPAWLCAQAGVFHAESGITTMYNSAGVIRNNVHVESRSTSQAL